MGESIYQDIAVATATATGIQLMPGVATGSVSLTGQPSNADAFTFGISGTNYVFTFKTALAGAGDVLIGASAGESLFNLYSAMFGLAGAGTLYGNATVTIPTSPNAIVLSYQPTLTATGYVPHTGLSIPLQNGVGYNFALTASPNVSTNLAVSAANLSTSGTGARKRAGVLRGAWLRPGSATATVQIYDSAQVTGAASGPTKMFIDAQSTWTNFLDVIGVQFVNGLYGVLTTTSSSSWGVLIE